MNTRHVLIFISAWQALIGNQGFSLGVPGAYVLKPDTDGIILDGAVVISLLKPQADKTFNKYTLKVSLPYVQGHLQHASRFDV